MYSDTVATAATVVMAATEGKGVAILRQTVLPPTRCYRRMKPPKRRHIRRRRANTLIAETCHEPD